MKNGIEFESKKQVTEFYKDLYENDHEEIVNNFVSTVKEKGYIKKSTLEEAREMACEAMVVGENIEYIDKYRRMKEAMLKYEQYAKEIEAQND